MSVPATPRQVQALAVLAQAHRPLTPAQFAARFWPDKQWARSGGPHETGPDASGRHGGRMLVGLAQLGLVSIQRRAGYWDATVTDAGWALLHTYAKGPTVSDIVRTERTNTGEMCEHRFYDGFDIWGYDTDGKYDGRRDRAPFQRSPFRPADEE